MQEHDDNVPEEVERLKAEHGRLEKQNVAKNKMLREKHGVVIHREAIEAKRVEFILDWLFPPGTVERFEVEVAWQKWIAAKLEEVHAEVLETERAERAGKGGLVVPPGKLIVPGG